MLGGAIGDALGFPIALRSSDALFERVFGRGGIPEILPVITGTTSLVSYKTQMTLFTAEGLIRAFHRSVDRGVCSPEAVLMRAYQRWLATQERVVEAKWKDPLERGWLLDEAALHIDRKASRTCIEALKQASKRGERPTIDHPPNKDGGPEGVARSAPIGLVATSAEEAFSLARDAAVITNGHPTAYLAAGCFAAIVWHVARGAALDDAIDDALVMLPERDAQEIMLMTSTARSVASHGQPSQHSIESLGDGRTALGALGIALLCARGHRGDSEKSIRSTLWRAASHKGAGDTTASLTGSLLGAMFGAEALPPAWVADVEFRDVVTALAQDLHATFVLDVVPDRLRYPPN